VYTEKQSEALSQTVFATKDSIDKARIDLADFYVDQASRIVKPPKKRIEINSVYKPSAPTTTIPVINTSNKKTPEYNQSKQRIVIIPEKYKNDTVVVVSSEEYSQLLKDKQIFAQLQKDTENITEAKKFVDEELIKQMQYADKMVQDLNIMQKKLVEKDLAILQRNIVIVVLSSLIGIGVYLRFKGGMFF
jgi:hypothetical protein